MEAHKIIPALAPRPDGVSGGPDNGHSETVSRRVEVTGRDLARRPHLRLLTDGPCRGHIQRLLIERLLRHAAQRSPQIHVGWAPMLGALNLIFSRTPYLENSRGGPPHPSVRGRTPSPSRGRGPPFDRLRALSKVEAWFGLFHARQ